MKAKQSKKQAPAAVIEHQPQGNGMTRLRVIKQVEGRKIGDEFDAYLYDYRLQIKHGSVEVV
jgi:hypothetical protein